MSAFVGYTVRQTLQNGSGGIDYLSFGISLSIPLYSGSKQSKDVDRWIYTKEWAERNYADQLNRANAELESELADARKNRELLALYENGILAQAEQSLQSALIGYQTDKVDFITLLNSYLTLYKLQLTRYRYIRDYNKNLANIDYITGKILFPESESNLQ